MSILPGPIRAFKMIRKGPWQAFKKDWFSIEAMPLYFLVGGTFISGVTYLLGGAGRSPEVIWSRKNPTPYNTIDQDETPKFLVSLGPHMDAAGFIQKPYDRRWTRAESTARGKKGEIATFETFLNRQENRGGSHLQ